MTTRLVRMVRSPTMATTDSDKVSSDNQGENEGPRRCECEDDGGLVDAEQGRRSGTAGMRWARRADSEVVHRPGTASVASRDGAVEGGFSEG